MSTATTCVHGGACSSEAHDRQLLRATARSGLLLGSTGLCASPPGRCHIRATAPGDLHACQSPVSLVPGRSCEVSLPLEPKPDCSLISPLLLPPGSATSAYGHPSAGLSILCLSEHIWPDSMASRSRAPGSASLHFQLSPSLSRHACRCAAVRGPLIHSPLSCCSMHGSGLADASCCLPIPPDGAAAASLIFMQDSLHRAAAWC